MKSPLIHLQIRLDVDRKAKLLWGLLCLKKKKARETYYLGIIQIGFGAEEINISISHSTSFPTPKKKQFSRKIVNLGVLRKLREEKKLKLQKGS